MSLSSELRNWTLASAGVFCLSAIGYRVLTAPAIPDLAPTLDALNRPCPANEKTGKPCGTLADLNRTLATVRGAVGTVEVAGRHYDRQLTVLDAQETSLYQDIHFAALQAQGAIADVRTTVQTVNTAAARAPALMDASAASLTALQNATGALQARISDKRVDDLLTSLDATGKNTAAMTQSSAGILADGKKVADHYEQRLDNPKLTPWYLRWLPDVPRVALQGAMDYWAARP